MAKKWNFAKYFRQMTLQNRTSFSFEDQFHSKPWWWKKNDVPLLPTDMTLLSVLSIKRQEKVHIYLCTSLKFQQCFTATVEDLAKARWWALILFWKNNEFILKSITQGPLDQCGRILTNVDQFWPMWINMDQGRCRSPPACKDHRQVAAKWQKCRFPIANMQFRSTNCRQCPHNLLAGIIIRQRLNRQSGAGRQTWFDPNLTSLHASASYCLLLPLLPHHSLASYSSFTSPPPPVKCNWNSTLVRS